MIKLDTLRPDDIRKILNLYEEHCGGQTYMYDPDDIAQALKNHELFDGLRVGSKWDAHSKLVFHVDREGRVTAAMSPNFDPRDRRDNNPHYVAAMKAAEVFRQAVLEL